MKNFLFLLLIIASEVAYSQPGPTYKNLNQEFSDADVIIIDSTSSLSRTDLLKDRNAVVLSLQHLSEAPHFTNFTKTTFLNLSFYKTKITDLSFLNQFPNLTYLRIERYDGEHLSIEPLNLKFLKHLEITYCSGLTNIESISGLNALEEIRIDNVACLQKIPHFGSENKVRKLTLDHMSNGRFFNEDHPKNYKTDLSNLAYLTHLEELSLGSLVYLTEIPSYLPKSIQRLEITGWALHHHKGDKVILKNIDNLKLYPNLKELNLYQITLEKFTGNFKKLSLDELTLYQIPNLTDISGAFTFKSIGHLRIKSCVGLKTISGTACTNIDRLEIEESPNIETINFLFTCPKINSLIFTTANALKLPNRTTMNTIPNIAISNDGDKIRLYKKDNVWTQF